MVRTTINKERGTRRNSSNSKAECPRRGLVNDYFFPFSGNLEVNPCNIQVFPL